MRNVRWSSCFVVSAVLASGGALLHENGTGRGSVHGAPSSYPTIIDDQRGPDVPVQGAMGLISAGAAAAYATGAGVHVAVLDGGFDLRHQFLSGHLGGQWDALDQDPYAQDLGNLVDDDNDNATDANVGHGTFVAGLIIACAPNAVVHPIRVLDDEGHGSPAALARGIDRAVELGAKVVNMSLVATDMTPQLESSIQAAVDAGVILVSSAGNDPAGAFDAPFLRDRSITVGAVNGNLAVAGFSPNQALVDVFAPGVDVLGPLGGATLNVYATWSGTSFASAFVSAAAALVKEHHPAMGFVAMRNRLAAATDAVTGATPSDRGSIDLLEAVQD